MYPTNSNHHPGSITLGLKVRHVLIDGEPWFVATDVCRCLGLELAKGSNPHLVKVAADERRVLRRPAPGDPIFYMGSIFGPKDRTFSMVSESGLYKLITRAHPERPEVAAFQDWVTREVLPSIRKTGGYLLNEEMRSPAAAAASNVRLALAVQQP